MNKDFILVASDSGACEIIRTEYLLKVYVEMPEANEVVFCWFDPMTGANRDFKYTPKPIGNEKKGGAIFYFDRLVKNLCLSTRKDILHEEVMNTARKSYIVQNKLEIEK